MARQNGKMISSLFPDVLNIIWRLVVGESSSATEIDNEN